MNSVYSGVTEKDLFFLLEHGFYKKETTQSSQLARYAKKGCTVTLFRSGKLLLQHTEDKAASLHALFSQFQEQKKSPKKETFHGDFNSQALFGSDETLKGDTFGGLIVSGFSYHPSLQTELEALGVGDSKQLSDEKIVRIALLLEKNYPQRCITIELDPQMYNTQLQEKSLTQLLNELHTAVASHKDSHQQHLVDKYPGCTAGDIALTQAEQHSLAVAAASILARSRALAQFEDLSERAGFRLPLGSTHARPALLRLKQEHKDFSSFAKLHFKNVRSILEE